MFLIGLMLVLGSLANDLSIYVKENVTLSIVVDDEMSLPDLKMLQKKLEQAPWVKTVQYINKETALKQLEKDLGENPIDLLGYNPLLASFDVFLKAAYANTDSLSLLEKELKENNDIQDVLYRKDLIHLVNDNIRKINFFLMMLAVLLTLLSYSLINNTVRLMIYSKRFMIRTMQLVGANANFIRRPFLLENTWSGLVAAAVAFGLLFGTLSYLEQKIGSNIQLFDMQLLGFTFVVMLIFGFLIITFATWLAVNRYLKMNTSDLYYV